MRELTSKGTEQKEDETGGGEGGGEGGKDRDWTHFMKTHFHRADYKLTCCAAMSGGPDDCEVPDLLASAALQCNGFPGVSVD